jgi:Spx/MgsR family transcriptional regulator
MRNIIVYGIPNCDTIKKTLDFLKKNTIPFEFHDYKKSGISKEKLNAWCKQAGWEILLNKKSSTWRGLSIAVQQKITDQTSAIKIMMENNSIIKRPVIEKGKILLVGFIETEIIKLLKTKK